MLFTSKSNICTEELNPIAIIAALFVCFFGRGGFRESSGSHIFGSGGGVRGGVTLREGLYTKELPILEDSDKSKQISSAGPRSLIHFPLTCALRGLLKCTTSNNADCAFFLRRYSKVNPLPICLFQTSVWTKG